MASHAVAELADRLRGGENNLWLVYEICKQLKPTSLEELRSKLPDDLSCGVLALGYMEYSAVHGRASKGVAR